MANIQKLTYPYFADGTTQLNAANLNPIISKMNEMIEAINSGVTPTPTVAKPTINVSNGVVTITAATGASIYYTTNGSTPTSSSTLYSAPFTPSSGTSQIKAIAVKDGVSSEVTTKSYSPAPTPSVAAPVISATWDGTSTVSISAEDGATIKYTTDGSTPSSSNGNTYSESFETPSGLALIKAVAIKNGSTSPVASTPVITAVADLTANNTNSKCKVIEGETTYYISMQAGKRYNVVANSSMDFVRCAVTDNIPASGVPYYGRQAGGKGTHLFSAYLNSDGSGVVEKITSKTAQNAITLADISNACLAVSFPTEGLTNIIFTESTI
jgi:hypothetical protein